MTLDEAIKHAEEVMIENLEKTKDRNASDPIAINCFECAEEHRQLAEWLKELKRHREAWQKVKEELKEEITGLDMFVEKEHTIRWCLHVIDNALGKVGEQNGCY